MNLIGPSYNLESRPASVQRTVNMVPVPLEAGNERTAWVFKDVPGLVSAVSEWALSPGAIPDDLFPSVVLLLLGEGEQSSIVLEDSSLNNRAHSTNNGGIDSGSAPFGSTSILYTTSQSTTYAPDDDFNIATTDFCFDVWAMETTGSQGSLWCRRANSVPTGGWVFMTNGLRANINSVWSDTQMTWTRPAFDEWHHYALCRDGTTLRMFIDGALVATKTGVTTMNDQTIRSVVIGRSNDNVEAPFAGRMKCVRWTSGSPRWTAPFDPPMTLANYLEA